MEERLSDLATAGNANNEVGSQVLQGIDNQLRPAERTTIMNAHQHNWRGNHNGEGYWCLECPAKMTESGIIS